MRDVSLQEASVMKTIRGKWHGWCPDRRHGNRLELGTTVGQAMGNLSIKINDGSNNYMSNHKMNPRSIVKYLKK
jgi:hypothetical protein